MVTTRPFMIMPQVSSPDYTGFARKALSSGQFSASSFADAMEEQKGAGSQSSVTYGTVSRPVSHEEVRPEPAARRAASQASSVASGSAEGETTAQAMPVKGESRLMEIGRQAFALDNRSLTTLQKLGSRVVQTGQLLAGQGVGQKPAAQEAESATSSVAARGGQTTEGITAGAVLETVAEVVAPPLTPVRRALGALSARFESGSKGIAAIGYDRNGGTSYGKYQISSRQGSFDAFLKYADEAAPDVAERLRKAGKPNTGGRRGAVPSEWQAIAEEQPERFEALQEDFIRQSYYDPVEADVVKTLGVDSLSPPLQEVLWSTSVQHGQAGARRLFDRAAQSLAKAGKDPSDEKALIETVYRLRGTQFGSSSPSVQAAVRQRFDVEKREALAMLNQYQQASNSMLA